MTKFFWKDTKGVNSDLKRHMAEEKELRQKIEEMENSKDGISELYLASYRSILNHLLDSKAAVVEKIGRK